MPRDDDVHDLNLDPDLYNLIDAFIRRHRQVVSFRNLGCQEPKTTIPVQPNGRR